MEMYEGNRGEYDMTGMLNSHCVAESLQGLSYCLEMALGTLIQLAINLKDPGSMDRLKALKDAFKE
jgi:hypothetical protein